MTIERIESTEILDGKGNKVTVRPGCLIDLLPVDPNLHQFEEREGFFEASARRNLLSMIGLVGPYTIKWIGQWPCGGINIYLAENGFGTSKSDFIAVDKNGSTENFMDIPKDKNYPKDAVQCDDCGGHGCATCDDKGWLPANHPKGRKCHRPGCGNPIPPDQVAVYCSNQCAHDDA